MSKKIVGLMSGTSIDGIDAALIDIEGCGEETALMIIRTCQVPFSEKIKERILQASHPESSDVATLCSLNVELGYLYAEAVKQVCHDAGLSLDQLDLIGSHGQTVQHLPVSEKGFVRSTLQIGDPSIIAYETKTPVISQFRSMDMAAGGEGAPLVPYADYLLYRQPDRNVALQNIGGIGNVTILPAGAGLDKVTASDTGPGNMLIDAACERLFNLPYDENGRIAAKGNVIRPMVNQLMSLDFFEQKPPKSTGREKFGASLLDRILRTWQDHPSEDIVSSLTAFTAETIGHYMRSFILKDMKVDTFIVSGGGSYNHTLMGMLKQQLPSCEVLTLEELGESSDSKEAVCFAVLANESWHGQYGNVQGATGAKERVILGQFTPDPYGRKPLIQMK